MLTEIILILLTLFILWRSLQTSKPKKYPPGPWSLPLIGTVSVLNKTNDQLLKELRDQYGDVVSVKIGTRDTVLIYDYKLIKEAFSGLNMTDRPFLRIHSLLSGKFSHQLGLLGSNGAHWQNLRKFTLLHLRHLGMGKSKMVVAIQNEALDLVEDFKKNAGKPTRLPESILVAVLNVIWQMVASKRYDLDNDEIQSFKITMTSIIKLFGRISVTDFFPWIEKILPNFLVKLITHEEEFNTFSTKLSVFLESSIKDHIETVDETSPRDFIDAYLIEMKKQKNDSTSKMSRFDLLSAMADLFAAGSETTSTTIEWSIFYMASHPEVQKKLQQEIDENLPKGTLATLDDKSRLPYTDAFIHEVLRFSSLVTSGLMHLASEDTKVGDFIIPKGVYVGGVLACPHHNPDYFESPENFYPERFLDSDGKFRNPKEGLAPFGIGKRQCLGEALARMELFILITTLVQNLNFAIPDGKTLNLNPLDNPLLHIPNEDQEILTTIR